MPFASHSATSPTQGHLARAEDARLLRGQGQYVHDIHLPGMLHAVFVRSMYARATLKEVDTSMAAICEGVNAVFTGADCAEVFMPAPNALLPLAQIPRFPAMAQGRLEFVGQPVALVVADTLEHARMAAELVMVDCDPEAATTDAFAARAAHAHAASGLARAHYQHGTWQDADAKGCTQVSVVHAQPRLVAMSLEPRAAVASFQGGQLTVWLPSQAPSRARRDVAAACGLTADQVRLIAPDVGGAFGAKSSVSPEDLLLACAAVKLGCSISWLSARSEEFTSGMHGRGGYLTGSLWVDGQGKLRHLQASMQFPVGAWLAYSAVVPARNAARILPGPYQVDSLNVQSDATFSNAAPVTIYRGAGRPEAALLMERLIERAARALQLDPIELRLRNCIPASAMPYATPTGETLDAGDYAALLQRAAERFGYAAERTEQARRRGQGGVVGIGTALYIEPCGQGWESARVTLNADGSVTVASGSPSQGQGHATSFAVIAADALGIAVDRITVLAGDSATAPEGIGALASRSMAIGGSAILLAAQEAKRRMNAGEALPLTVEQTYTAPAEAWSYGCVMARVAIDADTGRMKVERILWVDDAGHIVSPQLAEGQLLGGLAQGLGQAMMERMVYDDEGQLLTGSLMDYAVPRADDMPPVELDSLHVPTRANALGAKGVGEAGCIGVPAALLNAAADALSPWGEVELDFPLTPERLWRAMQTRHPLP